MVGSDFFHSRPSSSGSRNQTKILRTLKRLKAFCCAVYHGGQDWEFHEGAVEVGFTERYRGCGAGGGIRRCLATLGSVFILVRRGQSQRRGRSAQRPRSAADAGRGEPVLLGAQPAAGRAALRASGNAL